MMEQFTAYLKDWWAKISTDKNFQIFALITVVASVLFFKFAKINPFAFFRKRRAVRRRRRLTRVIVRRPRFRRRRFRY